MSLNKFFRLHWTEKAHEIVRVNELIGAELFFKKNFIDKKVDITITAYFDKRPLDASNICGKLYEDGLKGYLLKDDSPQYVRSMKTVSDIDKKNPRVELLIETLL